MVGRRVVEAFGLSLRRKRLWIAAAAVLLAVIALLVWRASERARLSDRVYRIGWEENPPFQSAGNDGQPTGLAIDLVKEAARRRGVRLDWVLKPEGAQAALLSQSIDLWPFVTWTQERTKLFHITEPYVETELCVIVPASSQAMRIPDLAHSTVVSIHRLPLSLAWLRSVLPNARTLSVATAHEAVNQVCQGHADAALLEEYNTIEMLLSGVSCTGVPLRWINVPERVSRLGVGSTFAAGPAADAIRDEIGAMAAQGTLENTVGQWGYSSGLRVRMFQELLNANRREARLKWGVAVFAILVALALWLSLRIHREREHALRAERSRQGTEERLRLMAHNLNQMVLAYNMDRELTYANPAVQNLLGYTAEELQTGAIDWIHPDDRDRMHALWEGLYRGEAFGEVEYRVIAKDGAVKWANATWGPIRDESGRQVGVQGSERDITERKVAEVALRESERRFRGLLENVHLSALMIDLDGRLTFCNDYVLNSTGWAREELVGHDVTEFMVPEDRERVAALIQALKADKAPSHWTAEPGILAKNGKIRRFQAYSMVLRDAQGKPAGVANIGADVTDHRVLQEQYLQAQKMEGLGRLAGGVAHDFNNLLTVINGYSEIIFRKLKEDDPLRGNADQVRKAGARAADLTRQLLTFSRKEVSQPKPLDLNLAVGDLQGMWERLLGEGVQLVIRVSPSVGQVMADAGQIHQVLMNLVVNARDAMPQGGTLVIETSNFEVDSAYVAANQEAVEGPHVLLAVSDTGGGMDEETKRRIFEPFFTTKPVGEGSGLGLATVFGIVKQSHGWIDVYSEPGMGSTFKVYLPRIQSEESSPEPIAPVRDHASCTETILLVEDQEEVRSLAKKILEEQGYRVLTAASADAALELANSYSDTIHLLLTDVVLPGMSSRELAERLIVTRPGIRVLFTSGYTREAATLRIIQDRGSSFLPKPYLPEAMAAKVRDVLDSEPQR